MIQCIMMLQDTETSFSVFLWIQHGKWWVRIALVQSCYRDLWLNLLVLISCWGISLAWTILWQEGSKLDMPTRNWWKCRMKPSREIMRLRSLSFLSLIKCCLSPHIVLKLFVRQLFTCCCSFKRLSPEAAFTRFRLDSRMPFVILKREWSCLYNLPPYTLASLLSLLRFWKQELLGVDNCGLSL